jgi:hypothetical protein
LIFRKQTKAAVPTGTGGFFTPVMRMNRALQGIFQISNGFERKSRKPLKATAMLILKNAVFKIPTKRYKFSCPR